MVTCAWCGKVSECEESVNTPHGFKNVCDADCGNDWWNTERFGWSEEYV